MSWEVLLHFQSSKRVSVVILFPFKYLIEFSCSVLLMQKCDIQDDSLVENVICDKNVVISKEKWLKGANNYPLIITKNVVI
jgi:ADP-glucose pyrophosphorylase